MPTNDEGRWGIDVTTLIRWDHLDHLAERHGIAVKDIWAEMQETRPLSCKTETFKHRANMAAEVVAKRAKEKTNVGG